MKDYRSSANKGSYNSDDDETSLSPLQFTHKGQANGQRYGVDVMGYDGMGWM